MSRPRLLVAFAVLLLPMVPAGSSGPGGDGAVQYELVIDCPDGNGGFVFNGNVPSCPVRAVDGQDMMGDPSLAVDPMDEKSLVIASLHGNVNGQQGTGVSIGPSGGAAECPGGQGPSAKSRCNQVFTTFTSDNQGQWWSDNPYYPPDDIPYESFGEHAQVTFDPYGHLFVGSLYAIPRGDGTFDYEIGAQKFEDLETINDEQSWGGGCGGCYHLTWIEPVYAGGAIRNMWFLFDPATDRMVMVWHELAGTAAVPTTPPACLPLPPPVPCIPPPLGATPAQLRHPGADVVATPAANATGSSGRSVIGLVWTTSDIGDNDTYERQPLEDVIGPCSGSTNPVLSEGYLYVGCVADPEEGEFKWHKDTAPGTLELFRMDPTGINLEYMGASPLNGGSPKLGVRSDGRLALATTQEQDGQLDLTVVFGHYKAEKGGIEWGEMDSLGAKLLPPVPGVKVVRPHIQDLIYREYSGVIHLMLRYTIESSGVGVDSAVAIAGPHIKKSIVAIDETHGLLAQLPLSIGDPLVRAGDPTLLMAPEAAYEDLSDDFLQMPVTNFTYTDREGKVVELGDSYQREFFAVGDYGTVLFAEVIEITNLRGPGIPPVPNSPAPMPAPAASGVLSLAPVAGVTLASLMAVSFVTLRRKNPAAALAKMKK